MATVAEGFVRLRPDADQLAKDIPAAIRKADNPRTHAEAKKFGVGVSKSFGGGFRLGLGTTLKGGIVAALGGAAALTAGATAIKRYLIDPASDLNETINQVNVVFGKSRNEILRWSRSSAKALGLSQNAALTSAAQFGDMFHQLGQTDKQSARTSRRILKLAADLGSFKNLETGDVLDRIAGGFRGEYDSLQLLIPTISAARVQTEAMKATGKKHAEALTAEEKAMATLRIITKDGANARNDFAETAKGAANQSKILSAEMENQRATLGKKLLPAYVALQRGVLVFLDTLDDGKQRGAGFNGFMSEAAIKARDLAKWVKTDLWPNLKTLGTVLIQEVIPALKPLVGMFLDLSRIATKIPGPLIAAGIAVAFIGGKAKQATPHVSGFLGTIRNGARAGGPVGAFKGALGGLTGFMAGGPWGAAFAIGGGILATFLAKQAAAKAKIVDFTATLDDQTGAVTRNSRAKVNNALAQSGVLQAAQDLGLNLRMVTDAALGDEGAQKKLNTQIEAGRTALKNMHREGKVTNEEFLKFTGNANKVTVAVGGQNKLVRQSAEAWRKNRDQQILARQANFDATNTIATRTRKMVDEINRQLKRIKDEDVNVNFQLTAQKVPASKMAAILTSGGGHGGHRALASHRWQDPLGIGGPHRIKVRRAEHGAQAAGNTIESTRAAIAARLAAVRSAGVGGHGIVNPYTISARWMSYPGHTGIDLAGPVGSPVHSAFGGRVASVRHLTTSYGKHVIVDHPGGLSTLYAHMNATSVRSGQLLGSGGQVGVRGSTGNSTGPHTHFETRRYGHPFNPESIMSFDSGRGLLAPGWNSIFNGTGGAEPISRRGGMGGPGDVFIKLDGRRYTIDLTRAGVRAAAAHKRLADAIARSLDKSLKTAQDRVQRLRDNINQMASSVREAALGTLDPSQAPGATQFAGQQSSAISKLRRWVKALRKLASRHLNGALYQQIAQMGPDQGLQLAESLATASNAQFRRINQQQTQIQRLAGQAGNVVTASARDDLRRAQKSLDVQENMLKELKHLGKGKWETKVHGSDIYLVYNRESRSHQRRAHRNR